jgi:hypothetical protein
MEPQYLKRSTFRKSNMKNCDSGNAQGGQNRQFEQMNYYSMTSAMLRWRNSDCAWLATRRILRKDKAEFFKSAQRSHSERNTKYPTPHNPVPGSQLD